MKFFVSSRILYKFVQKKSKIYVYMLFHYYKKSSEREITL